MIVSMICPPDSTTFDCAGKTDDQRRRCHLGSTFYERATGIAGGHARNRRSQNTDSKKYCIQFINVQPNLDAP